MSLKSRVITNFVNTGGKKDHWNDNIRCQLWRQCSHHGNALFSVIRTGSSIMSSRASEVTLMITLKCSISSHDHIVINVRHQLLGMWKYNVFGDNVMSLKGKVWKKWRCRKSKLISLHECTRNQPGKLRSNVPKLQLNCYLESYFQIVSRIDQYRNTQLYCMNTLYPIVENIGCIKRGTW